MILMGTEVPKDTAAMFGIAAKLLWDSLILFTGIILLK